MSDRSRNETSPWAAFLLGAIIVAAAMLVYLFYADQSLERMRTADVRLIPPAPITDRSNIPIPELPATPDG